MIKKNFSLQRFSYYVRRLFFGNLIGFMIFSLNNNGVDYTRPSTYLMPLFPYWYEVLYLNLLFLILAAYLWIPSKSF